MHDIVFTALDGAVGYRVVVSDRLEPTNSTDKSDFANNAAAMGTVGGGKDAYRYTGRKLLLETNDLDGLLVSINGSAPEPARNFDVAREVDFSQEFGKQFKPAGESDDNRPRHALEPAPDPDDSPGLPKYDTPDLGDVGKDEAIGGGTWIEVENPDPAKGKVSRYATTKKDETFYIDENEDGGAQAFINRLPYEFVDEIKAVFSDGHHTGNGSSCRTHSYTANSRGSLTLSGEHSRDETRIAQGINMTTKGGKQLFNRLRDIEFGALSQFSGPVDIRDCAFEPFERPGVNARSTSAISGKNGWVHGKRLRIGTPDSDYAIHSTLMERYALFDTEFAADKQAIVQPDGSEVVVGWGCSSDAPRFATDARACRRGIYRGGKLVARL